MVMTYEQLVEENIKLNAQLEEVTETIRAIRHGEVDALVISTEHGDQIFSLISADQPYRLLVEEMQKGAVTVLTDGTILYCNQFFTDTLIGTTDSIISLPVEQFIVQEERKSFHTFLHTVAMHGSSYAEFNVYHCDQDIVPVGITANKLFVDETLILCLVLTDLREQKRAEKQAIELMLEKQRTKVLSEFVRDTSHDLRTPITIILSKLQTMRMVKDEARRNEKIEEAEYYTLYLNRVLEQHQQMAVLDSLIELKRRTGEVKTLIHDAIVFSNKQARSKNITVVEELAPENPIVEYDIDTLFRALIELMENAIRFTPNEGQVWVRSRRAPANILIVEVVNNGEGIAPDVMPRIFERFYKGDKARQLSGGAGLGLPMVKRIMELHDGFVEADSVPGEQTCFRLGLPIVRPEHEHA